MITSRDQSDSIIARAKLVSGRSIAMDIRRNQNLQKLELWENHLTPKNIKDIADAIKTHPNLRIMIIASNDIEDEGARYIAEALEEDTCLQEVNL